MQDIEIYFSDGNREITDIHIPESGSLEQRLIKGKSIKSNEISRMAV